MKPKDVLQVVGILTYLSLVNAVPVIRLERETLSGNRSSLDNECVSEDIIYQGGDEVPSPGPCEQCVCKPPNVECTMIKCKTNSGCKMIQRANHCCPDYTCDCEHKGRIYNNGERLELEDAPCQVCYCKGGDVMCTSITCYERTDCQPRYVPGQCCPKYDHCPLETNGNSSGNSTVVGSKREIQTWPINKAITVKPIEILKQTTAKVPEEPAVYPQTLKIHEILPTTPKYERPNGKRPALSTVPKVPLEIHIEEIASPVADVADFSGSDNSGSLSDKADGESNKTDHTSQLINTVTEATSDDTSDKITPTVEVSETTSSPSLSSSNAPVENSSATIEQLTTTEVTLPDLSYEIVNSEKGLNENLGNLIDLTDSGKTVVTPEPTISELDKISTGYEETTTELVNNSTENLSMRMDFEEGDNGNASVIDNGSTTLRESLNYEVQFTSPESELTSDSEIIYPTSSSFTSKLEPIMLSGGIYDELNDTMLYSDDNDVKQEETTPREDRQEYSAPTTENPDELSSFKSIAAQSALSEVFEKFVELPQPSVSSIRRSDDWLSQNYQLIPGEGVEEAEDRLLDLNVGATSHTDRRVSPAYYLGDPNEGYLMTGRSLAPYSANNKDAYSEKVFSEGKFHTTINRIAKVSSNEESSESESSEEMENKINPDEQTNLYLSITGKNSSSNETILHMILSPKDLKHLAERIIKENSNKTESNLKGTEVRIEWLTQEQLSKLRPESPKVNINLTKCNFTGFTDLDLKSGKIKVSTKNIREDINEDEQIERLQQGIDETSEENALEISTILLSTISELMDSTTLPYSSSTEPTSDQNMETTTTNIADGLLSTNTGKQGPDASTIRVYEIRKSGNINDKLIDLFITTEGPYGSDKGSSPTFETSSAQNSSPKSEINKRSESIEESSTPNDFETTSIDPDTSERLRKKNLPDVEPFLRQLPSTLDEKDVSILRDFLERHLSEPLSR